MEAGDGECDNNMQHGYRLVRLETNGSKETPKLATN